MNIINFILVIILAAFGGYLAKLCFTVLRREYRKEKRRRGRK